MSDHNEHACPECGSLICRGTCRPTPGPVPEVEMEAFHVQFDYKLEGRLTVKVLRPVGSEEDDIVLTQAEKDEISSNSETLQQLEDNFEETNAYRASEANKSKDTAYLDLTKL